MADCYCFLCGGNAEVSQALDNDIKRAFSAMSEKLLVPDPAALAKLRYGPHDVAFQQDLCLIGPFDEQYDVLIDGLVFDTDVIEAIDVHTVRVLDNVVPGDLHQYATVRHQPTGREYVINGTVYPFVHAGCWHIFRDVLGARGYEYPERTFWGFVREMNLYSPAITAIEGITYGLEIENTHGGEVVRPLANLLQADQDRLPQQLVSQLEAGEISEEILDQYWLGCGAMWVNVSPHCFPSYEETLQNPFEMQPLPPASQHDARSPLELLPVELLVMVAEELDRLLNVTKLLLVSKTLRHKLIVRMDAIVKELAGQWMVPPVDDLAALERAAKSQGRGFPWVKYAHTCAFKSPSMRNRRRIFDICEQIARLAGDEPEDLDDEQLGDDVEVEEASTD